MTNITSLYKRHKIIYTDPVPGKFNNIRILSMSFMALIFFLSPWFNYNGRQALIFDLKIIKIYFFKYVIWPQDFIFLAILIIILVLLLFAITVYVGRVWCGFLCPQSIWIRLANFISRIIEGDRLKRFKLDNNYYNKTKLLKKIIKHFFLLSLSIFTAITFVGYFVPIVNLYKNIFNFSFMYWSFFWILFFTIITYFNIYWFKEQFCFLVCPYARLQSVMFDENTLIVAYDEIRGEKRGHRNKKTNYKELGLGDCIDCKKCVTCCPTGIDIRNGLQIECISCAACIDACDSVMEKMNYPKGLIKYKKENLTSFINMRLMSYVIILIILTLLFISGVLNRDLIQFTINRSQIQLYNKTQNNYIENFYTLKITNKTVNSNKYKILLCNDNFKFKGLNEIFLSGEETILLDIIVTVPIQNIKTSFTEIYFKIENTVNKKDFIIKKSKFISPL